MTSSYSNILWVSPEEHLTDLNPQQLQAVQHLAGPILILAGAGSGKTRVLTRRVAHLVLKHGVRPNHILAVTFTNKATNEMRERLHGLLGEAAKDLWVATFHSAALRILRRHAPLLSYSHDFIVYDEQDSRSLLKGIMKELGVDEKRFPINLFSRAIDQAKNALVSPEEMLKLSCDLESRQKGEVYDRYQRELLKANAMDFGDLLYNAVLLFRKHPEVLAWYQHALHYVLVDEFQDTNPVQYELLRMLTKVKRNLLAVGDDDQSIYAFRGATIKNILEFEHDFPDTKIVKLEQNYRSTGNILEVAHAVISNNQARKSKKLWTSAAEGNTVATYVADDEADEADFVTNEIRSLQGQGAELDQFAVFYRTNAQSRAIEEALINARIPYRIYGGLKFYERKEIKDIVAYLRLLVSDADNQSFLRTINTPPRGIGAQSVQSISNLARDRSLSLYEAAKIVAEKNKSVAAYVELIEKLRQESKVLPLAELIHSVYERTEYWERLKALKDPAAESRLENLLELEAIGRIMSLEAATPAEALRAFLDRISLTSGGDLPEEEAKAEQPPVFVSLMTLHLAKGLEFPYVFLTGLEEGLLPHYRSIGDPVAIEEERRLCYVGITRAMRQLYCTRSVQRGLFGSGDGFGLSGMYREPSRFIHEMPSEKLESRGGTDFASGGFQRSFSYEEEDELLEVMEEVEAEEKRKSLPRSSTRNAVMTLVQTAEEVGASLPRAKASELSAGGRVIHPTFGSGIIEKLEGDSENPKVTVKFDNAKESKKLAFKQARLALG